MNKLSKFLILLAYCINLNAQDIVIKNNKDELKVKVIEIEDFKIKYKEWDNIEGPIYSMKKNEIFMVIYQNGKRETFATNPNSEQQKDTNEKSSNSTQINDRAYATLYVYRPVKVIGFGAIYALKVDDGVTKGMVIDNVYNGAYFKVKIYKEGDITFWANSGNKTSTSNHIEFGKSYYLKCGLKPGMVLSQPTFEWMDPEIGASEYKTGGGKEEYKN